MDNVFIIVFWERERNFSFLSLVGWLNVVGDICGRLNMEEKREYIEKQDIS